MKKLSTSLRSWHESITSVNQSHASRNLIRDWPSQQLNSTTSNLQPSCHKLVKAMHYYIEQVIVRIIFFHCPHPVDGAKAPFPANIIAQTLPYLWQLWRFFFLFKGLVLLLFQWMLTRSSKTLVGNVKRFLVDSAPVVCGKLNIVDFLSGEERGGSWFTASLTDSHDWIAAPW